MTNLFVFQAVDDCFDILHACAIGDGQMFFQVALGAQNMKDESVSKPLVVDVDSSGDSHDQLLGRNRVSENVLVERRPGQLFGAVHFQRSTLRHMQVLVSGDGVCRVVFRIAIQGDVGKSLVTTRSRSYPQFSVVANLDEFCSEFRFL